MITYSTFHSCTSRSARVPDAHTHTDGSRTTWRSRWRLHSEHGEIGGVVGIRHPRQHGCDTAHALRARKHPGREGEGLRGAGPGSEHTCPALAAALPGPGPLQHAPTRAVLGLSALLVSGEVYYRIPGKYFHTGSHTVYGIGQQGFGM